MKPYLDNEWCLDMGLCGTWSMSLIQDRQFLAILSLYDMRVPLVGVRLVKFGANMPATA